MQSQNKTPNNMGIVKLGARFVLVLFVVILAVTCVDAQDKKPPQAAAKSDPCKAEVVGSNVKIRSGPGTNYYECGRLNLNDTVFVLGDNGSGWSKITPPPKSFSWIAMDYVSTTANKPTVGTVTGRDVIVYAGSDYYLPKHSTTEQMKLKQGDKVNLLNEEKERYLKIEPPEGCFLWVYSAYLRRVVVKPTTTGTPEKTVTEAPSANTEPSVVVPPVILDAGSPQAKLLEDYDALQIQVKAELAKPISEQSYDAIELALTEISQHEVPCSATKYAQLMLNRVKVFKLALAVSKQVEDQDRLLNEAMGRIDKARAQRIAIAGNMGRYAVIGTLKKSSVYNEKSVNKRYRIVDGTRTICYVKPVGKAANQNVTAYFDKKVGLIGKISANVVASGALVEFTGIELIKSAPSTVKGSSTSSK
jgi:hypothetical protein